MRRIALSMFVALAACQAARADFLRWSAESEADPFSGGKKVSVDYMSSVRSGVFMLCDSTEDGLKIRVIPGYAYVTDLDDIKPNMEFAIDGKRLIGREGKTLSVGDNLAAAEVVLKGEDAATFIVAFGNAKSQVAIRDGISDAPHLLKASGSTLSGKKLAECYNAQPE